MASPANPYERPHSDVSEREPGGFAAPSRRRIALAFLLAPLTVLPAAVALSPLLLATSAAPVNFDQIVTGVLALSTLGIPIAYLATLTYGAITFQVFRRRGLSQPVLYAAAGVALVVAISAVVSGGLPAVSTTAFFSYFGAVVGFSFGALLRGHV